MKCTHPDHNDNETCHDRSIGCHKDCECCMELTPKEKQMARVVELRSELFDIANSMAGNVTGGVACQLHGACNDMLWAKQTFDSLSAGEKQSDLMQL